ncbi:hypothetical protein [uncultured Friedmanniella sp.]|uniref:hypothetical protein n=1 Tax=uncultured Friedmanniella sp. TaxID=335381 RepID=UPI0035CBA55F
MSEPALPPYRRSEVRAETEAALAARRELGPEYDEHIAAGLAERVEQLAAYRSVELQHSSARERAELELAQTTQRQGFVLGIISLGVGIPITAISANLAEPHLLGIAVSWAGIVGVNVAHRLGTRRGRLAGGSDPRR